MYVTGRLPLLVALGALPVVLVSLAGVDAWAAAAGWIVLCAIAAGTDVAAAPSPRALRIERRIPRRALLGQRVETELRLQNTGARRIRGRVRDAWQPTAGAPYDRLSLDLPGGEARRLVLPLLPRRRGELHSEFVVVRSDGPLRLAGRQTRLDAPGAL